jgi:hypothetical protein
MISARQGHRAVTALCGRRPLKGETGSDGQRQRGGALALRSRLSLSSATTEWRGTRPARQSRAFRCGYAAEATGATRRGLIMPEADVLPCQRVGQRLRQGVCAPRALPHHCRCWGRLWLCVSLERGRASQDRRRRQTGCASARASPVVAGISKELDELCGA